MSEQNCFKKILKDKKEAARFLRPCYFKSDLKTATKALGAYWECRLLGSPQT
jgi:hypothetical protein